MKNTLLISILFLPLCSSAQPDTFTYSFKNFTIHHDYRVEDIYSRLIQSESYNVIQSFSKTLTFVSSRRRGDMIEWINPYYYYLAVEFDRATNVIKKLVLSGADYPYNNPYRIDLSFTDVLVTEKGQNFIGELRKEGLRTLKYKGNSYGPFRDVWISVSDSTLEEQSDTSIFSFALSKQQLLAVPSLDYICRLKIYPNPVNNILHLSFLKIDKVTSLTISDILGRVLQFHNISEQNQGELDIYVSSLTSGLYWIQYGACKEKFVKY